MKIYHHIHKQQAVWSSGCFSHQWQHFSHPTNFFRILLKNVNVIVKQLLKWQITFYSFHILNTDNISRH